MKNDRTPKRRTFLHSFADAFRGIWDCLKSERNMRFHLTACVYVLFFAFRLGLSRGELACVLLAIGLVLSAETMNTAVEKLCDYNQKTRNPRIRVVKDVAAGAVLLSAVAAAALGVTIFWRPELWDCLRQLCTEPLSLALLALSAAAAVVFIAAGPEKIAGWFARGKRGRRP